MAGSGRYWVQPVVEEYNGRKLPMNVERCRNQVNVTGTSGTQLPPPTQPVVERQEEPGGRVTPAWWEGKPPSNFSFSPIQNGSRTQVGTKAPNRPVVNEERQESTANNREELNQNRIPVRPLWWQGKNHGGGSHAAKRRR